MRNHKARKLTLNAEAVRVLTSRDLDHIAGGNATTTVASTLPTCNCPPTTDCPTKRDCA